MRNYILIFSLLTMYFVSTSFAKRTYDSDGYDNKGYDRRGYDQDGYNILGYDKDGFNRYCYDEDGFDKTGHDKNGYDEFGYDAWGNTEEEVTKKREEEKRKQEEIKLEQLAKIEKSWKNLAIDIIDNNTNLNKIGTFTTAELTKKMFGRKFNKHKASEKEINDMTKKRLIEAYPDQYSTSEDKEKAKNIFILIGKVKNELEKRRASKKAKFTSKNYYTGETFLTINNSKRCRLYYYNDKKQFTCAF